MNDGGPAFPHFIQITLDDDTKDFRPEPGMSLRDYFAAEALNGLVANGRLPFEREVAGVAYDYADAMLRARRDSEALSKPQPGYGG